MFIVLSPYPLSAQFKKKLDKEMESKSEEITITKLRSMSLVKMVKFLRSLKSDRVMIPLEDENSKSILPIISILALLTRANEVWTVNSTLTRQLINKRTIFMGIIRLFFKSCSNLFVAAASYLEAGKLLREKIIYPNIDTSNGKISYLKTNLWFGIKAGGSVGHIAGVVNAFVKKNYDVDFYGVEAPPMVKGAKFYQLPIPMGFGIPSELNMYSFDKKSVKYCEILMKGQENGFLYQRMSIGNMTGVTLSRKYGLPLVLEYNGSEVWIQRNWGKALKFERLAQRCEDVCLKHAHVIVTISKALKDELVSRGVPEEKIVFYPNCIDPEIFDPSRFLPSERNTLLSRYSITVDATIATFLGTFGQWHGVEVLAQAIKTLVDTKEKWMQKNKLHFLVVGDGLKMPQVKEILSGEKYKPFYTLTGLVPQEDAPQYLATSDILLSPHVSNSDGTPFFGSPTKLFEYMAMGKAIVASDLDQIGEVLENSIRVNNEESLEDVKENQRVAVLVHPGSHLDLMNGIMLLVEQKEIRDYIGGNARRIALNKYTWACHVDAIFDNIKRNYN